MDKRETNSDHEMEKDNFVNRGEGYLIFKELDINNTVFLKDSELQFTIKEKLFFSVHFSEFSHKISNVFRFSYFKYTSPEVPNLL